MWDSCVSNYGAVTRILRLYTNALYINLYFLELRNKFQTSLVYQYPVSYLMQRILDYNYKENIFLVDNEFNCMLEIAYKITKHKVF